MISNNGFHARPIPPMMTGLTNTVPGDDPTLQGQLCAATQESVATAPFQAGMDRNTDTDAGAGSGPNSGSWREEVAVRLERFRTRRKPRSPRYPSLLLPFDAPESWSRSASPGSESTAVTTARTEHERGAPRCLPEPAMQPEPAPQQALETSAKVIEFPRSAAIPVFQPSNLADPVFDRDRPRIVEAPEILPPPPALGGMLIEPAQQESADRRADLFSAFPSSLSSASIVRRTFAALVDGVVVATSVAVFAAVSAAIFLRLNPSLNPGLSLRHMKPLHINLSMLPINNINGPLLLMLAGAVVVVTILLWASYEFLFVVYTGSTPGLRITRLRLAGFDGAPLNRRLRRWRVLASFLSAFSAGLGYFWCILDQNGLCWHDRITRTHVQLGAREQANS